MPSAKYPDKAQVAAFYDQLLARINALPGVQSADAVYPLPLSGSRSQSSFTAEGPPVAGLSDRALINTLVVGPDYFMTMGVPLVQGRPFTSKDTDQSPPVAIIDSVLAKKHWPGGDPIGKRIKLGAYSSGEYITIIGIVGEVKSDSWMLSREERSIFLTCKSRPVG